MYKPRTFKQNRAMNLNWNKARLMAATAAVQSAHDNLMKYTVHTVYPSSLSLTLLRIEFLLAECLNTWDEEVWGGLKDE